jgi:hypothetical protein
MARDLGYRDAARLVMGKAMVLLLLWRRLL